jgi:hypothetical protein
MDFWIYAGPIAVAAVGYFIAAEISNLRKQITKLNETQTQMAIYFGAAPGKIRTIG